VEGIVALLDVDPPDVSTTSLSPRGRGFVVVWLELLVFDDSRSLTIAGL
jgi:hypothetical protein